MFPTTHELIPFYFWANTILFWLVFVLIMELIMRTVWKPARKIPLAPLIVGSFYFTVFYGGLWRALVDPIIPIILGA